MANYYVGSVADVDILVGNQLVGTSTTQLDNSITTSVNGQEVRSGKGNILNGMFFSDSKFEVSLTEQMWKMDFVAKTVGGTIAVGANDYIEESITLATANAGTTVATPASFGTYGTIGWVSLPNANAWQVVTFTGKNFTSPVGTVGSTVCVRFFTTNPASRELTVNANFIPDTVSLLMRANLYAGDSFSTSTKVGQILISVPRFIFDGSTTLSLTSNGFSNSPLKGMALSVESNTCASGGYYAKIVETITSKNWYDDVTSLVILDSDVDLAVGGTQTLEIRAINSYGNVFRPPYADLTISSGTVGVATVNSSALVTGVSAGSSVITALITAKNTINAVAVATVV